MLLRAGDQLTLNTVLRLLDRDTMAMGQLRKAWRKLHPALSASVLDDSEVTKWLRRDIAAHRLSAVLLSEAGTPIELATLPDAHSSVMHVPLGDCTLLISPKGQLPRQFARFHDNPTAIARLERLNDRQSVCKQMDRQANRLPRTLGTPLQGAPLRRQVAHGLATGACDAAVLTDPRGISQVAARKDAPVGIGQMSAAEKVAEAVSLSTNHLTGAMRSAIQDLISPENLAVFAGTLIAVALAQLNPVSAALVDGTLVILAWASAGIAGVRAVGDLVKATAKAMDAASDTELDEAAQLYAAVFVTLGAGVLQALMTRSMARRGNTAKRSATERPAASKPEKRKPAPDKTGEPPEQPKAPTPSQVLASAKAALSKRGVPKETLDLLKNEKQIKAFEQTLDEIDALDRKSLPGKENIFYSGMAHGKPAWMAARKMAEQKGMNWITSATGGVLDKYRASVPPKAMDYLDALVSKKLAQSVKGPVTVLGDVRSMNLEGIFYKHELPALLDNPNVPAESKAQLQMIKQVLDSRAKAAEAAKSLGKAPPFNPLF
ncbi:hypothetical protein [Novosphingobium album (ex Liu et al. 2023)]|uniref:Uncharacterized protein n=1 Tax=Novosphingobium album (ex Liu et al. 2023) TaxID=3031130 RepID=A0ABT5WUW0_9SPHN|nr:hypothetical protein [Novosphingobium album (ex Liu et al. 2023)]MDE8653694.1 hypothetical protein [Novosphingobium album (ex Liu et al. 2023)]